MGTNGRFRERPSHLRQGGQGTLLALLLASALVACEGERPSPSFIVEGPELVLTEVPLPPEVAGEPLFRVVGMAAAHDSEGAPVVALADQGNHRLLFWWPNEGRIESFGGEGEGPGEFRGISGVWALEDGFAVSDTRNARLMFVSSDQQEVGTAPRELRNMVDGGAFLPGGLYVAPSDDTAADPFRFRELVEEGDRVGLGSASRPDWFPDVASVERPVHPAYEEAGLLFPPAVPGSTDVTVALGERLVWIEQRTGHVVLLPLGGDAGASDGLDDRSDVVVAPIPEPVIGSHVRWFVDTRDEEQMRQQHFQAFLTTRRDAEGRRALLPILRSTGQPLGWLLEDPGGEAVTGRLVRLAEGEELPYPVRSALPLSDGRFLVGHEGGVTLLVEESGP